MLHSSSLPIILIITLSIFFIIPTVNNLQISLSQYSKLQSQSLYYIFHPYSSKSSSFKQQNFPLLQKLIFTTPWNPQGNELTLKYAKKLDYIIPCCDGNYNQTYIKLIRKSNASIKILPRVLILGSKTQLIQAIGTVEGRFKRAVSLIATLINKQDVDGFVIQTTHNLFLRDSVFENQEERTENTAIKNLIIQLVNSIRINLYKNKLIYFNLPNPGSVNRLNQMANQRYAMLHVDGFMIQAFDSINYDLQLKLAIQWLKLASSLKSNVKYFVMLPFFSRRQRQGIKTTEIHKALQTNGFIYQNVENGICTFVEVSTHVQSYVPCFKYFKMAFQQISEAGFDVGFYEAGDGLENYFLFL